MQQRKQLVVIGGGAAGFFCAINAAIICPGLEVTILEKTNKLLSKVRISGGGRCNVTHACESISEMVKKYPRGGNFVKKAFHKFFTRDTVSWFEARGVALKTEHDGRMFPVTDNSATIIDCFMREAERLKIVIRMNTEVRSIAREGDRFNLKLASGTLQADFLVVASGGYPKLSMFDWLRQTGHQVEEPVPSLFTFNMPKDPVTELMGVVVQDAQVRITGSKIVQSGPVLMTHWGMSGPGILKTSAWGARLLAEKGYDFSVMMNWSPRFNENSLRDFFQRYRFEAATQKMANRNPLHLPQRFWDYLLKQAGIDGDMRWADLPGKEQHKLIKCCCAQEFKVSGKTTFKEEFVTSGGISLQEVDPETMMSRIVPNLFFAGEVLDVDGVTGGYNFQHAWTSGYVAALGIGARNI